MVALYFAVQNEDHRTDDGKLLILAARRLNAVTGFSERLGSRAMVGVSNDLDTSARALLAVSRNFGSWKDRLQTLKHSDVWEQELIDVIIKGVDGGDPETLRKLKSPWAVFPNWKNDRVVQQSGMFTVFGGKRDSSMLRVNGSASDNGLPEPDSLEDVQNEVLSSRRGEPFLLRIPVDATRKAEIKRHLRLLGIHGGSLFPEVDHQAEYIRDVWLA